MSTDRISDSTGLDPKGLSTAVVNDQESMNRDERVEYCHTPDQQTDNEEDSHFEGEGTTTSEALATKNNDEVHPVTQKESPDDEHHSSENGRNELVPSVIDQTTGGCILVPEQRHASRSQSMIETGEHPPTRPNYGAIPSCSDVDRVFALVEDSQNDDQTDDINPSTSGLEETTNSAFGQMPGMTVEITRNENDLSPQKLPESLRYVMLNVVGTRPRDEIKFRRLKYRVESGNCTINRFIM